MDTYARRIAIALVLAGMVPLGGCRICADCEDLAYPAYGGAWERTRRDSGRVGSLFDPAGAQSASLVERDVPPTPDALERKRQDARVREFEPPDRIRGSDSVDSGSEPLPGAEPSEDLRAGIDGDRQQDPQDRDTDVIDVDLVPRTRMPAKLR